jgi:hypothetical protein
MEFTYGDEVLIKRKYVGGTVVERSGVVVGMTTIQTDVQAQHFNRPVSTTVYTGEFGDGSDALISGGELRPASS